MCWSGNTYGHVAVVEQVCNVGTKDEYILISQSYYGGDIGHIAKVEKRSTYLGVPYSFAWGYKLEGFCISPVCQLCNAGEMLIEIQKNPVSYKDITAYKELVEKIAGTKASITSELKVNDNVLISWFGNEKSNGKGKRVGFLDAEGKVASVDRTKEYPFGVKVGGKVVGYWKRDALEKDKKGGTIPSEPWTTEDKVDNPSGTGNPGTSGGGDSGGGGGHGFDTGGSSSNPVDTSSAGKKYIITERLDPDPNEPLNVRKSPTLNAGIVDVLHRGDIIESYETTVKDGYTWHRIGTNKWCANYNNCFDEYNEERIEGIRAKTLVELHVRSTPSADNDNNIIRKIGQGQFITVLEITDEPDSKNLIWNRISASE